MQDSVKKERENLFTINQKPAPEVTKAKGAEKMTDKQIMETLFSGELSIGQMEEIEETREALKDPDMRRELVRIARILNRD